MTVLNTPIEWISIPPVGQLDMNGLVVVVGPNSSGKSQLLRDLRDAASGTPRELVVAESIKLSAPPSVDALINDLVQRGDFRQRNETRYESLIFQHGAEENAGGAFELDEFRKQHAVWMQQSAAPMDRRVPDIKALHSLSAALCSVLQLRNRLTLTDEIPAFDTRQRPTRTLQSLYLNKPARLALTDEVARIFQRSLWVDNTRAAKLLLRISDSPTLPSAEDRLEPSEMEKYRTLSDEGDGIRAYVAICASLLLATRPLLLVDEPEMCLHPPQAHAIGSFIARHANQTKCVVVSTHSPHVLRGILESTGNAKIVRLSRNGAQFEGREAGSEVLATALGKPRARSEELLEGLFSHGVVVCEGDGDRIVYEAVYRTLRRRKLDLKFVPADGTGGFSDPVRLFKSLEQPVAIVADIDFLAKAGELKKMLPLLGASDADTTRLCAVAAGLISALQASMTPTGGAEAKEIIGKLAQYSEADLVEKASQCRGMLGRAATSLHNLGDFKKLGLQTVPEESVVAGRPRRLRAECSALIEELKQFGLYVVSVGQLESWLPVLMKASGKLDKASWAMRAAEMIEFTGEREDDVWGFVWAIAEHVEQRLVRNKTS
jgi:ABC-type polar amino acid transport system ATPase subunit